MAPSFSYTFSEFCQARQKIGYFYNGNDDEKTIYGRAQDQTEADREQHPNYKFKALQDSDLAFVDSRKFYWYDMYLPTLESIFENENLCQITNSLTDNGDNRTFYQLDCEKSNNLDLGISLMANLFLTHEKILDSAIGLCSHSLTLDDWKKYTEEWNSRMNAFHKRFPQTRYFHMDTLNDAWPRAKGRPTQLLAEPAIEINIQKLVTSVEVEQQPFHIDDHNSCFTDDLNKGCPNYGSVTMLLPGSSDNEDQVSTEISTLCRDWECNGRGIWFPTNILHRGRKTEYNRNRHVYLIEVHANGTFIAKNGVHQHECKNVKAFRMTLSQLLRIKGMQKR